MIEAKGPTNTRVYTVAVYFRGERLAKAEGHSIQQAEMAAAKLALDECGHLVTFFFYAFLIPPTWTRSYKIITVYAGFCYAKSFVRAF